MRNIPNSLIPIQKSILLFFFCLFAYTAPAQISHGGKPLPLNASITARSLGPIADFYVDMPTFDVQEALMHSKQEETKFKSLEFAHKFHPFLRPDNSGITFIYGNMKVWRVGIRSNGAYSLNILFSKFRLPPGAQVFVYNDDQSEILGSYTEKNNTDLNLLPVQPIAGDALIVEYQEPLGAAFEGEIEVGEVNHDFIGILKATEPRDPAQSCHPNLVCYSENIQPGSGVVLLVVNGSTLCTGVLVNNTKNDGTPYLLTATHCLNDNYLPSFIANRRYDLVAGSIVAFFNYNSPLCGTNIRGPVQMSMASADSVLISERHDISLLKLKEVPPAEYQPYYLGWNANDANSLYPFHGLHHPNGGVKKVAIEDDRLSLGSFSLPNNFASEPSSFWEVRAWDVAATEGGSSGSPLLDRNKRVIGTLTGGVSGCGSTKGPDSYASLYKFWDVQGSIDNPNKISDYLAPGNQETKLLDGFNPYASLPYTRSNNFKTDENAIQTSYQSIPLFATNNTLGYTEYAEEFLAREKLTLQGVFIASPPVNNISDMDIRIKVYSGENEPGLTLLHEQPLQYNYRYYSTSDFNESPRSMGYNVENYIRFDKKVEVTGPFYISYYDANEAISGFSAFNTEPRSNTSEIVTTAWMKNTSGWIKASENLENPVNTSLLISPYVIGNASTSVEMEKERTWIRAYFDESKRINIVSNNLIAEWEIFYSSGLKVHHKINETHVNRDFYQAAHLPKGVYIVRAKIEDGSIIAKKVLVI